jgi:flagellar basal body-associated protein FliL
MSEEQNDGSWSGLVKTIVGTVGTIVTAGGAYLGSLMFSGDDKAETAQPAAVSAPAPVINITTNNSQQQAASNGGTKIVERVVEKPAAPKKKSEKEALQEEPKW